MLMKNNCSREQKPKRGPLQKLRDTHKKANRGVKRGGVYRKSKSAAKTAAKSAATFYDVQHRAGRGLAGCGRARATTELHDAGEAQAAVRRQ